MIEELPKKDEGKGTHKPFPDLLMEMGVFLEEAPLPAYILKLIDHHVWRDFCASQVGFNRQLSKNSTTGRLMRRRIW